jgi:hypothetical protein
VLEKNYDMFFQGIKWGQSSRSISLSFLLVEMVVLFEGCPIQISLNDRGGEHYSPALDAGPIAGYFPSYYWYPFILLGQEKQLGLSTLFKDTE